MSGDSQSPIAISSPASACSPGPPTLAPRAASVMSHDAPSPAGVVTHKEWVVPPRPKPGRKPATDTPPTKRKAQNRAAQRAFRERRAARVNELEDKLKEVELENAVRITEYQDQVNQLTKNNSELAKENSRYKTKVEYLQKELELLRQVKADQQQQQLQTSTSSASLTQVASPAPSSGHETPCNPNCACTDDLDKILCDKKSIPSELPIPKPAPSVPIRRRSNRNKINSEPPQSPDPLGCGRCSKDGNCACITETAAAAAAAVHPAKRPTSPSENTPKRTRITNFVELAPPDELATDFTTAYMTKPPPAPPSFSDSSVIVQMPPDPCGFCSDGTHCVCAEAVVSSMMNMEDDTDSEEHHSTKLPPLLSNHTPPPPEDRNLEGPPLGKPIALHPPMTKSSTGLGSGCQPGGCVQCKNDPMSTLFCQSVATKIKSHPIGTSTGCCGGGCCGDGSAKPSPPKSLPKDTSKEKGTFIPCSAAYQALSRHRGFGEATVDLGSLLRPLTVRSSDGRCPQIEVNSVRDVLKQLDRRFGSDAA